MSSEKFYVKTMGEKEDKNEESIKLEIPFHVIQDITSDGCNLQTLCRICLSRNDNFMIPLASTIEKNVLAEMFTYVSNIKVSLDDGLPSNVCMSCRQQIRISYDFKRKCVNSDETLKSLLISKAEFTTKDENINEDEIYLQEDHSNILVIKDEYDTNEDIQYYEVLEEYTDDDKDELGIVHNTENISKEIFNNSMADTSTLFIESSGKKKMQRKPVRCSFCTKRFPSSRSLKVHMKKMHGNKLPSNPCDQCTESFFSEHDLKLHSLLHQEGPPWKCNKCQKEFNGRSTMRRHIQRHMESKRHSCDTCGKPFAELYALRRHTRVHTGEIVEKKHACHICDKRYSESGLLVAHLARHSNSKPCVCSTCGKAFVSVRLLASHVVVHSDRKPYACQYCDKRFRHESTRTTHHRTHTGEKPYVCSDCGKTFIQKSNLTLHMRTHTGERPYACTLCDRKFSSSSSLKSHERTHSGERPYSCNICGKRFTRMNMSLHMRLHTGERPFSCTVCDKRFITASRLRDHARIHTGEKPYECATCEKKFLSRSHIIKHVKTHQSKNDSNRMLMVKREADISRVHQAEDIVIEVDEQTTEIDVENTTTDGIDNSQNDLIIEHEEVPIVSEELVLQDSHIKNKLIFLL